MSDEQTQPRDDEAGDPTPDADLAAGRYQDYAEMDDLIADLDTPPTEPGTPAPPHPRRRLGTQRTPEGMIRRPEDRL